MEDNSIILNELGVIKQGIVSIRKELADRILSRDDLLAIEDYKEEKKSNSLVSHENLKKELNQDVSD